VQQSLLDRLVELIKLDYPEDWGRLCDRAHATEPSDIVDVGVEAAPAQPSPSAAAPVRKPVVSGLRGGRPPEFDYAAITEVIKDCATKGVEEFLDRFAERVREECGRRHVRTPKSRTQMRDICRPIWDAARGESTQK
jgi:hypothetical protein